VANGWEDPVWVWRLLGRVYQNPEWTVEWKEGQTGSVASGTGHNQPMVAKQESQLNKWSHDTILLPLSLQAFARASHWMPWSQRSREPVMQVKRIHL
jgi:hypothetical protein